MPRTGLWLQVFVALLLAALPPILLVVGALLLTESLLGAADPSLIAVLVVVGAIAWAAILAVMYARSLAQDILSFLSLAERGEALRGTDAGPAYDLLSWALEERNRQVDTLAREARAIPIDDHPQRVVGALVGAVRSVMGDPTWRCAVLSSESTELLPEGVHMGLDDATQPSHITDLEQWLSMAAAGTAPSRAEGQWGAFAVVDISVSDRLRAVLYAPWEGRPDLSPAEVALLSLVGQHFGTALEHSLLYARVRSQADELTRLAGVQADFLRGVTHDLQTPLTSIGALATELQADEAMPETARADLETITHQADRLRRMVSQLLVASRLEAGVLTPRVEVFAVSPIIHRTWTALRADRPFTLVVEGSPHLAVGDPDRVEQVLWALLDNAVKYSPAGSAVEVTVEPSRGQLVVSVKDGGLGMESAVKTHAFDQFYRSEQARKMAPDGSGVGLYAARGLIEAMGGQIDIDSELGVGTRIRISLPAEPASAEAGEDPASAS